MNLLQGLGQAKPVSEFINTAGEYQRTQSSLETQRLQQQKMQAEAKKAEEDDAYLNSKKDMRFSAFVLSQPEDNRDNIINMMKSGGYIDENFMGTPKDGYRFLEEMHGSSEKMKSVYSPAVEALGQEVIKAFEKARKNPDDKEAQANFQTKSMEYHARKGKLDDALAAAEKAMNKPEGSNSSDPSVVKTFEAARPDLVPKRGTMEYGKALEAFIKSGERPYSTFVGLTPDGKKAILFDSRKGSISTQPLPFEGQIQPKINPTLPTEQTTSLQQIGTLKEALGSVNDLYDESFVGPIAGPLGKKQDNWGIMPDSKRAEFRTYVSNLYNTIIYLRSGKQINEEEAKRLLDELPTMNVSPVDFKAKLAKFTWELNSIERGRLREMKKAGYRNVGEPSPAATPATSGPVKVWDPATKTFKVQ